MRVACGGTTACHAEYVAVPETLVVPVPDRVPLEDAAYTTVASIALHGIRTGQVQVGDRVLVIGLGLLGQIATRLCVAAGAHVFGVDPRADRAALARASGAEEAQISLDFATAEAVQAWSHGRGADVVLITAGGADGSALRLAGEAARDRARVVVVGAVSLDVPREPFYHKELMLVVSRSYGPGRYDPSYEEKGMVYPPGFVPWTERRNMEEFLDLLATGRVTLEGLKGLRLPFERAPEGYAHLSGEHGPSPISVLFEYAGRDAAEIVTGRAVSPAISAVPGTAEAQAPPRSPRPLRVGFVGAGNFASTHLLPAVASMEASLTRVVTASPLKAERARTRWGFTEGHTDPNSVLEDDATEAVFIATRHDTHAAFTDAALRAGKAVFVEKPLALTEAELERVASTARATGGRFMVGFNRRFAPAIAWTLDSIGQDRSGLRFLCRVNAGPLPHDHWLLDPDVGGGRLLGEGCHFIDLACHVAGARPVEIAARRLDSGQTSSQDFSIDLAFANGATASIEYISSGDPSLPKERFEFHRSGVSVVLDDFLKGVTHRAGRSRRKAWSTRDKGHRAEVRAFLEAVRTGGPTPIPEEESLRSTWLTLAAARSIREGGATIRSTGF
jgi:predicted dehydrogenase/threonine dehydrogenase-like Zn-dependent dehydrogenase